MPSLLDQQLDTALLAYQAALPRQSRLLQLAGKVLQQLAAVRAGLPSAAGVSFPEAEAGLYAGEPVLTRLLVPTPGYRQILSRLLELCQEFELLLPLSDDLLQSLLALPSETWLGGAPELEAICQGLGLPMGLLYFLGQKALSPFYQQAAAPYAALFLQGVWQQGSCPSCGQKPALSSLAPDSGQRLLYCSLCAVQWPFSRRACVFCGQEAPHFSYLFVEDDPARRADLCQVCRRYLKTIVISRLTYPMHLSLEEFVTIDLDILMARDDLLR